MTTEADALDLLYASCLQTLAAGGLGVLAYDVPPQEAALPFITVDCQYSAFTPSTGKGIIAIKVWSSYEGSKEVMNLMKSIVRLFDRRALQITGLQAIPLFTGSRIDTVEKFMRCGRVEFSASVHL